MSGMAGKLPAGVAPQLGPDATGVGWGLEYVLIDRTGRHNLAELRTLQDWHVQYQLRAVPGVAEVAAVGAYVKQYQVTIDPDKLLAYDIPINRVVERIRMSNQEVGGRVIEFTGREYMVRGRGYIKGVRDIEEVSLGTQKDGTPIRVRDVGDVQLGPDIRRGVVDYNGLGDAAGGVVVVRFGESVYDVLQRVKQTIRETVRPSLPEGVELVVTYDRSALIEHSVATLREKLIEESLIVSLVCVVFLFHFRSALVAVLTLPLAVLLAFLAMRGIGLTSNIMSLGGIAIAIGAMIDAAIVMIENAHKHVEHEQARPESERRDRKEVIIEAAKEVGPSLFFSLLIITVGFLPVFALQDQEGRLFKPLAYTKTFSMLFAALLSITVAPFPDDGLDPRQDPARGEEPGQPVLDLGLPPLRPSGVAAALPHGPAGRRGHRLPSCRSTAASARSSCRRLWEGTLLYMPVTLPGASIETMREAIQDQDRILMTFPEVVSVFAKAGRAETATDPAPLEMVETVVNLKAPEQWRPGMTPDRLIAEMDAALKRKLVGFSTSWTMPIKGRIDMLSTGIRTPIGIKIFGPDLGEIARLGREIEAGARHGPRHPQRLRRARLGRLLPRLRRPARRASPATA